MDDDPPPDQLMVPINVPESIWAVDIVFATTNGFSILQSSAQHINTSQSSDNLPPLNLQAMIPQVPDKIPKSRLWSSYFECLHKVVEAVVADCRIALFQVILFQIQTESISVHANGFCQFCEVDLSVACKCRSEELQVDDFTWTTSTTVLHRVDNIGKYNMMIISANRSTPLLHL